MNIYDTDLPSFLYFHLMKTNKTIFSIAAVTGTLMITAFNAPKQQPAFSDKYWMLESSSIVPAVDMNLDGKPDNDLASIMEECDKDDAEMFKSDGKVITHHGTKKCDEDEAVVIESGVWKYDPATKQITSHHIGVEKPQVVTIKELTASKMVVTYEFSETNGKKHTITGTYKVKEM